MTDNLSKIIFNSTFLLGRTHFFGTISLYGICLQDDAGESYNLAHIKRVCVSVGGWEGGFKGVKTSKTNLF